MHHTERQPKKGGQPHKLGLTCTRRPGCEGGRFARLPPRPPRITCWPKRAAPSYWPWKCWRGSAPSPWHSLRRTPAAIISRLALAARESEVSIGVWRDAAHRVLGDPFRGTLRPSVYPREIQTGADDQCRCGHLCPQPPPSGMAQPSQVHESLTRSAARVARVDRGECAGCASWSAALKQ
jgi:hypothetical protein